MRGRDAPKDYACGVPDYICHDTQLRNSSQFPRIFYQTPSKFVEPFRQFFIQQFTLRTKSFPSLSDRNLFGNYPSVHPSQNHAQIVECVAVNLPSQNANRTRNLPDPKTLIAPATFPSKCSKLIKSRAFLSAPLTLP